MAGDDRARISGCQDRAGAPAGNGLPAVGLMLFLIAAFGCSAHRAALRDAERGRLGEARSELEALASKGDKNVALYSAELGIVCYLGGDLGGAIRALMLASAVMNTAGGAEIRGYGSLVIQQSLRRFKGEPFEKAMVDLYIGILSWLQGDAERAKVGLRRAILADESSQEGFRQDFSVADYLLATASLATGDEDTFAVGLRRASAIWPDNPYLKPELARQANLVVLIEGGHGPVKEAVGLMGSQVGWQGGGRGRSADITLDGNPAGRTSCLLDLSLQARTSGKGPTSAVQTAKAGVKTGALATAMITDDWRVQVIALLVGLLLPAQADTRQVGLLPGGMYVWAGRAAPGVHEVIADTDGRRIVWRGVRVYEHGVTLVFGRDGFGPVTDRGPPPRPIREGDGKDEKQKQQGP